MHIIAYNRFTKLRNTIKDLLRLFFSSNKFISIENIVRSIPEYWLETELRKHVVGMQIIRHACAETYSYHGSFTPAFRTEMHFAKRHIYHLMNATVNVKTSACVVGSLCLQESYGSLRRCLIEKPFPVLKGRAINNTHPITCFHSVNYYHFLLEEIPRLLWVLNYCNDLTVLVHDSAPSYVIASLNMLRDNNIFLFKIKVLKDDTISLANYVFTQAEAYSGFVNNEDILLIRKSFLEPFDTDTLTRKKIYITRKSASRAFENENEIVSLMLKCGFSVYSLEEMDFKEQILLFTKASIVVASHGAGLANVIWCISKPHIIEIFSPHKFNDCYARLCSQIGLEYTPIWAESSQGWGRVDLDKLSEMIMPL